MIRNKHSRSVPQPSSYALVTHEIIKSKAFKALSHPARTAFLILRAQCNPWNQRTVMLPFYDMKDYMSPGCFARAIKDLEDKGFIRADRKGRFPRVPNDYTFIERWKEYRKDKEKRPLHGKALKNYLGGSNKKGKKHLILATSQVAIGGGNGPIATSEVAIITPCEVSENIMEVKGIGTPGGQKNNYADVFKPWGGIPK